MLSPPAITLDIITKINGVTATTETMNEIVLFMPFESFLNRCSTNTTVISRRETIKAWNGGSVFQVKRISNGIIPRPSNRVGHAYSFCTTIEDYPIFLSLGQDGVFNNFISIFTNFLLIMQNLSKATNLMIFLLAKHWIIGYNSNCAHIFKSLKKLFIVGEF